MVNAATDSSKRREFDVVAIRASSPRANCHRAETRRKSMDRSLKTIHRPTKTVDHAAVSRGPLEEVTKRTGL